MNARDPLDDPRELIRRVYSYAAYRVGPGPDAEDITSETMMRAVRYRSSYDARKGKPVAWLLGIARSCVDDLLSTRQPAGGEPDDLAAPGEVEAEAVRRLTVADAVARLDPRDRDLIALRYGADLNTRQISELLGLSRNAVDVALHRSRARLDVELRREGYGATEDPPFRSRGPAAEGGA
ncbi:MAG: sigma-70 family RNA polymerase sigma factor [Actinobacteria bacterium]|nr:sigma-70 family RNA polymerase sigma factor [Actinomycetota bacterium]